MPFEHYRRDVLHFDRQGCGPPADAVSLLGWENFDWTYDHAISVALTLLKPGGALLFTYQDDDDFANSEWDEEIRKYHPKMVRGVFPPKGYYLIDWASLERILTSHGLTVLARIPAGETEGSRGTTYPQYLVVARYTGSNGASGAGCRVVESPTAADDLRTRKLPAPAKAASLKDYENVLRTLRDDPRNRICSMREFCRRDPEPGRVLIGIRHDVDSNLPAAWQCGECEAGLGLSGTYFFLFDSPEYYGQFSNGCFVRHQGIRDVLKAMQDRGAEVGFHNNLMAVLLHWGVAPDTFLREQLQWLREGGVNVFGTVSHCSYYTFDGVVNFEFFAGQTLDNRKWATVGDRQIPVGRFALEDFGLEYDANCIQRAFLAPRPFKFMDLSIEHQEVMVRDYHYHVSLMAPTSGGCTRAPRPSRCRCG